MKTVLWTASLGAATLFLSSCGGNQASNPPAQPVASNPPAAAPAFDKPTVAAAPANTKLPVVAVPGMLQPTNSQTRLSQISTASKRDPFAAVLPQVIQIVPAKPKSTAAAPRSTPRKATAQKPQAFPQTIAQAPQLPSISPIANLPPLPVSQAPVSLPITAPPVSRTNLADAIAITGVVQVGGKVNAIVQSPDEATARYVQAGAYLANGRVLLKRIIMGKNGEPTIVLQQDGIEVFKSVGSTSGPLARAL